MEITKERADELIAAWDAATSTQRLTMQRVSWVTVGDDTSFYVNDPSQLERKAAARIAELEDALDTLVMAAELPGDHCEIADAVAQAKRVLAKR